MTFLRWTLHDPSGTLPDWTLPINPNQMGPQQLLINIEPTAMQEDGRNSDRQTPTQPLSWTFDGVLYSLTELDTLEEWLNLGLPVVVTDHFGYQFQVVLISVDTVRAGKRRNHGRHTYQVHALLLKRIGA